MCPWQAQNYALDEVLSDEEEEEVLSNKEEEELAEEGVLESCVNRF